MEVASPAGWMVMHSSGRFFKKVEESFMERLNYEVLKKSGYDGYVLKDAPEKVLQFGEGNFLRAFVVSGSIWPTRRPAGTESAAWYSPLLQALPI